MDKFFEGHAIRWEYVIGVCTHGSSAMLVSRFGFQTLVKKKVTRCDWYTLHYSSSSTDSKKHPDELKIVLNNVIKALNVIEANALNSRLFANLCKESDSKFKILLLHSHVKWLSKEKVLKRVFVLQKKHTNFHMKLQLNK